MHLSIVRAKILHIIWGGFLEITMSMHMSYNTTLAEKVLNANALHQLNFISQTFTQLIHGLFHLGVFNSFSFGDFLIRTFN